jgi:hypothetical protein
MRVFVLAIGQRALTLKPLVRLKLVEIAAAAVIQRIRIVVGFKLNFRQLPIWLLFLKPLLHPAKELARLPPRFGQPLVELLQFLIEGAELVGKFGFHRLVDLAQQGSKIAPGIFDLAIVVRVPGSARFRAPVFGGARPGAELHTQATSNLREAP